MSDNASSRIGVDELLEDFIRLAKAVRSSGGLLRRPNPERAVLMDRLEATSESLLEGAPVERLRPLFDHQSDAVRVYAVRFLMAIDEELGSATIAALGAGLATSTVMAYCVRSRRGPPPGPPLKDMSIQQLTERYEDAGIRSHGAQFMGGESEPWNVALSNATVGEMIDVRMELRSRNAEAALLPFLEHENITVRRVAARQCLSMAPEKAIPVLEAIEKEGSGLNQISAAGALFDWRQAHQEGSQT
jgi:hypothetical protein